MKSEKLTVIGPGRMGLGIALAFALNGFKVAVIDGKERTSEAYETVLRNARKEAQSNLKLLKRIGYLRTSPEKILSKISFSHNINEENLCVPFIFEAIPEKPNLKIELFRKISRHIQADSILASTTSTINLKTLKKGFIHPDKLLITHWLNPAFIIPLVEISVSEETDARSIDKMKNLLKGIGKVPIVLKDSPGFIVPANPGPCHE